MTHTKEKPTVGEIIRKIREYGRYKYDAGAAAIKSKEEKRCMDEADYLLSEIRTIVETLVNNQK